MTISNIIKGFEILKKYGEYDVCAEHDIIYGGDSNQTTTEENEALEALGWHIDSSCDSWAAFV